MVGFSHETSEAAYVGQRRLSATQVDAHLAALRTDGASVVLVSTCHRTELYWWGDVDLVPWFEQHVAGRDTSAVHLERREADLAVRHLFAVTAGMRSARYGEPEIMRQVRAGWQRAQAADASHTLLDAVFRRALEAARHIRHAIGDDADPSLGERVCDAIISRQKASPSAELRVLVVGAGDAARGVLDAITRHRGAGTLACSVQVTSRTDDSAARACVGRDATLVPWQMRDRALRDADVAVFAVHASAPLIDAHTTSVLTRYRTTPALWLDLGVPSNVASEALPDAVQWIGLDMLAPRSEHDTSRNRRAHAALQRELARYASDMQRRHLGARLPHLEARAASIARAALGAHAGADADSADALARQVTRLLLREMSALSA